MKEKMSGHNKFTAEALNAITADERQITLDGLISLEVNVQLLDDLVEEMNREDGVLRLFEEQVRTAAA